MFSIHNYGNGYAWMVRDLAGRGLAGGLSSTRDGALRAARNFMRRNQSLVFTAA